MFNLIMGSASDWQSGEGTISVGRLFEYTEETVVQQFKQNGVPQFDKLAKLPCLFMQEGVENELAYVGYLTDVRPMGRDIRIEYRMDPDVPPLRNSMIFENQVALDMTVRFEFSRHHWAVKDVDLFRFLLRKVRPRRQHPKIFQLPEHENIDERQVSVMMPFSASFQEVYESIRAATESLGLNCHRADDIWEHPEVMRDVVALIDRSQIVVCDCSGRNPNVFYEAGIAHTLGRDVLLITQSGDDIPFDLRHLRYIRYLNNAEGRAALETALQARMQTLIFN